ncbi:PREDICTED: EMBRYO SURROUNDING FACTOR 1-like protein 7 [Camelina sativa]|uniref:EMBRYO SURROUNDING FACTOR 1-like protein 7 n=1 Tax=Camelina sativa TaxID=90675 RepID=A0ABM1QMC2_CAMSA|nr:PREDICTED: EMBRYO SURROUNDING FACTOR 1-like protein 7 [Camelina sativa]
MKSSHIALICIVIFSLFTLHECGKMEDGETKRSILSIHIPPCIKTFCTIPYIRDCWCCLRLLDPKKKRLCWKDKDYPNAKELCYAGCSE